MYSFVVIEFRYKNNYTVVIQIDTLSSAGRVNAYLFIPYNGYKYKVYAPTAIVREGWINS